MSQQSPTGAASPVTVERMRWWDLEQVLAIESVAFPDRTWTAAQFWSELARVPESRWYGILRREGAVVGYAGLNAVPPEADVLTVAVAPTERGLGHGRLLMGALVEESIRRGVRMLHLEVASENEPARMLYESLGFVPSGRRRDYYGRGHDALLMSLRVPSGGQDG